MVIVVRVVIRLIGKETLIDYVDFWAIDRPRKVAAWIGVAGERVSDHHTFEDVNCAGFYGGF
jgi:hypothetical protein